MPHPAADAIPSTVNTTDPRKRFPRSARVRTRAEYSTVFNGARRVSDPLMTLHWLPADRPARLGLAVSRKVDPNAVGRNRVKRVLRDALRHLRADLQPGDYVVVARSAARQASNDEIRQAFQRLLRRLRALPAPAADGTMPPPVAIATSTLTEPASRSGPAEPAC
ncbi:ribonuclease P protein component [Stenotrophomonas sp. 24(2023)]|uniref:ribonuclease P protein component n=1 Tax=Stenotrophomonas sp. 24(2023) TaxID=3068324 RepID=UPI0027E049FC|nr:ribonuclease P protein component [Stenotrophomonas sp. 24(2023)]WMJ71084.1 ribonuclease P protein component [Stenotrophomonas sp. 24(2023)]